MPDDPPSGARPPPVVLRIKLRYDDVEAMVQRFAPNVGKNGLFLPTRSLQPVGTEVKFELRIANDTPVLVGLGRVKAARAPDPANPRATFGMAIELLRVTREGRDVIIRMIERRRAMGLRDVAIPMPEDVEAARRAEVGSVPRAEAAAILRAALAASSERGEREPKAEPLLTSPRPAAGPLGIARSVVERPRAPVLAPEPARAKRPRLADVIAKAGQLSGSAFVTETVAELDAHVDVGKALARARVLAGASDLDAELAALRESAAAPLVEISVEAASAELARQLGGAAVGKRMRVPGAPISAPTALGTAEVATIPAPPAPAPVVAPEPAPEPAREDDPELSSFERALEAARVHTGVAILAAPAAPVAPDDARVDAAEVAELEAGDLEELPGESTQIGRPPDSGTSPSVALRLDEAERAARARAISIAEAARAYEEELDRTPPVPEPAEEISDLDVLAEADAEDADLMGSRAGEPLAHDHPAAEPSYAAEHAYAEQVYAGKRTADEDFDFASQLDLGDDSSPRHPPAPYPGGYDTPSEYTLAERIPSGPPGFADMIPDTPGLDAALELDEPTRPSDDLESALSTLDVDLDQLEVPRASRGRLPRAQRASDRGSRPLPGMPPERGLIDPITTRSVGRQASEDDGGVLIDFEDE